LCEQGIDKSNKKGDSYFKDIVQRNNHTHKAR
jgi:hypothetical protein